MIAADATIGSVPPGGTATFGGELLVPGDDGDHGGPGERLPPQPERPPAV